MIRVGTRKSELAKVQTRSIQEMLREKGIETEMVEIESEGDQNLTSPLYAMEGATPGVFAKQLQKALLAGTIDLAVHSLKDLPTQSVPGIHVACIPPRAPVADCLVIAKSKVSTKLPFSLPEGAHVGTSSLRREAMLLSVRPDLKISSIRGNVPTRVRSVEEGKYDAAVLAEAGLGRLNLKSEKTSFVALPAESFVPAPGQGALAVEARDGIPENVKSALSALNDPATRQATHIERLVLQRLEGGCTLPLGVWCEILKGGQSYLLRAFLGVQGPPGKWDSFHHFELESASADKLVDETVKFFEKVKK